MVCIGLLSGEYVSPFQSTFPIAIIAAQGVRVGLRGK